MSGKVQKKIRQASRKRFRKMVRQIGEFPLRQRLWFAWKILKGSRRR